MTKFEEEFKALTRWDWVNVDLIQQILTKFGNWHSDEEFQAEIKKLTDKLITRNDELISSNYEIESLKSQLQQQALPVVKDFVAEWYEEHKDDLDFSIFEACVNLHDDCSSDFEKWFGNSENKSIETLVRMKDGYTVEKPQLFYLKHIDMSKTDKEFDWYLMNNLTYRNGLSHSWVEKDDKPQANDFKFTQLEIDKMNTGSYEQIGVEK